MAKREYGTGGLYRPPGSTVWWCYYPDGKGAQERESTGERDTRKAQAFLDKRRLAVAGGNFLGAKIDRVKVSEIMGDVLRKNRLDGNASVDKDERNWRLHLEPFFGQYRCSQVTTALVDKYVEMRKQQEIIRAYARAGESREVRTGKYPENASVNRELALLRAAFWLAHGATPRKVAFVPTFHMLPEVNVRKGFVKDEQYAKLAAETEKAGLWLRAIFEVLYMYGWRKGEAIRQMRVRLVDLDQRTITIEDSKNGEGRTVKMTERVYELLRQCCEGKQPDDYVFTRNGRPVKDFRRTWKMVTTAAGVPGLYVHDLRRTGARNLRRLGVAESVIMKVTGHKTPSVFRRYDIVDQADMEQVAALLDDKQKREPEQQEPEQISNTIKELSKYALDTVHEGKAVVDVNICK
jgi:integrase